MFQKGCPLYDFMRQVQHQLELCIHTEKSLCCGCMTMYNIKELQLDKRAILLQ